MDIATQYAKALFELSSEKGPRSGEINEKLLRKNLFQSLKARGREKLLPRIFAEYKKLLLRRERLQKNSLVTPEAERTRVLLELYHKLIRNSDLLHG